MLTGGGLDGLLADALPGASAAAIEYLDRGVVNSNYRIDLAYATGASGPRSVLLRLSRSFDAAEREGALGRLLAPALPGLVPVQLATGSGEEPEPHRRSLLAWIEGTTLEELPERGRPSGAGGSPDATEGALDGAARELAAALATLHAVRPGGFGRFSPGLSVVPPPGGATPASRWVDDLARRLVPRFRNPAHGMAPERLTTLRRVADGAMDRLAAAGEPAPSLVHGDLSPGNLVLAPGAQGLRLAGLVDWETARAADAALDLASLRFELGERWPRFAAVVESHYRELRHAADPADPESWERRVHLASLPLWLDARMVAMRIGSAAALARVDRRIDAFIARSGRLS